jgi:protein TonB
MVEGDGLVYRVGRSNGDIGLPKAVYVPDPIYSETARHARVQGGVVLDAIVDPSGHTRNIWIVEPLGNGLDEQAVQAVKLWRFEPAPKDGKAVSVEISVSVPFNPF